MAFKHDGEDYWCGRCERSQQTSSGIRCIGCGGTTVSWQTNAPGPPPYEVWNQVNGFPPGTRKKDLPPQTRGWRSTEHSSHSQGVPMSNQARFDPDRVEAFADRLKVYIRTLDDYDGQVANALSRLGEAFDDDDYQELCTAFAQMRGKLRDMVEGSATEISRIESMCADVRASQAVSIRN